MRALQTALTSPLVVKVTSLILAFMLWSTINQLFTYSTWVTVPVCFYNVESRQIDAPESIELELTGKRGHLKHIAYDRLAVHIDAAQLPYGTSKVKVSADQVLLPPSIAITTTIPHHLLITITRGDS